METFHQASASSSITGHAYTAPTLGSYQTNRFKNNQTVKSSQLPPANMSVLNSTRNVGRKTTVVVELQSEGLPLPESQPRNLVNEPTSNNPNENAETAVSHKANSKKEVASFDKAKSDVKTKTANQRKEEIGSAAIPITTSNDISEKPSVQPRNNTHDQKQPKIASKNQIHLNAASKFDESKSTFDSFGRPEGDETSSEDTSAESNSQDITDDRSDLESISDMSEVNDVEGFQFVSRRKKRSEHHKTITLPNGIEVICQHFEANPTRASHDKVCKSCETNCFYAYQSVVTGKWQRVRPYPTYLKNSQQLHSCYKYKQGTDCKQCTHPHGPELEMWELERHYGKAIFNRF